MKTLAHEFLEIEAEDFEVPQEAYKTLEDLLKRAKETIDTKTNPRNILSNIGKLLKETGYKYKEAGWLLSQTLPKKGIDCRHYSLLYCSIAEELGLPVSMVPVPKHVFVRWEDENTVLSWETTANCEIDEEEEYIPNINKKSLQKGVYLRGLTRGEAKASAFNARATEKCKNNLEEAIADYNMAIELNQKDAEPYCNRGLAEYDKKDFKKAIIDFNKALDLDPDFAYAYNNRGIIRFRYNNLEEALADLDKAIELESDFAIAYHNRGLVKEKMGDKKGAKKDFKKYKKLKKKKKKKKFILF